MLFLCRTEEVAAGDILRIETTNLPPLAVYNLGGSFHVTDDTCTHGEASLADGEIDGNLIECPFHAGCFDIATGEPAGAPCTEPIKVYAVEVKDGKVFIET